MLKDLSATNLDGTHFIAVFRISSTKAKAVVFEHDGCFCGCLLVSESEFDTEQSYSGLDAIANTLINENKRI